MGLGGYAVGTASADPQGQLGTATRPLRVLYTQEIDGGLTGGTPISDLLGDGLSATDGTLQTSVTGAVNRVEGNSVFTDNEAGTLGFRSFVAGSNITIEEESNELVVEAEGSTINNDGTNLGTGTGLYAGRSGRTLEFRSLVGGTDISLSTSGDTVTIDASGTDTRADVSDDADGTVTVDASGEANTASNVGAGAGLFKQKAGVDLEFRSLTTTGALTATANTDTVSLAAPWADGGTPLFRVAESGLATVRGGSLQIDGGNAIKGGSGNDHLIFTPGGPLTLNQPLQTQAQPIRSDPGRELSFQTDIDKETLYLGPPSSDGTNTAGGNVLAGHPNNTVTSGAGIVIAGGGANNSLEHTVDANYATIGGGLSNSVSGLYGVVSGGHRISVSAESATAGGGFDNLAGGADSTVAGGRTSESSGSQATVGGGDSNFATGGQSTVPGGIDNVASGRYSLAAGRLAETQSVRPVFSKR